MWPVLFPPRSLLRQAHYLWQHKQKCCFHLLSCCEAAEWTDQWSYEGRLYFLLSLFLCVVLVTEYMCASVFVFILVFVCRSSSFQVYRQFVLHPVIMAQRYTHYVSVSVRHCSNPLWRGESRLSKQNTQKQMSAQIRLLQFFIVFQYFHLSVKKQLNVIGDLLIC